MGQRTKHIQSIIDNIQSIRRKLIACDSSHAITHSQWMVVSLVAHNEASSVKETAHALDISSSAATQLIDGLVEKGYILRESNQRDRRSFILTLSPECKKHLQNMKTKRLQDVSELFQVLTDRELARYAALNQKIAQHALPHTSSRHQPNAL